MRRLAYFHVKLLGILCFAADAVCQRARSDVEFPRGISKPDFAYPRFRLLDVDIESSSHRFSPPLSVQIKATPALH